MAPAAMNPARLQALAQEASSPTTADVPESTVLRLFDVARRGDMTEMYAMLKKYPTIWQSYDSGGCTAMHAAASSGSMDMAQLLMQAGMGVRDADKDGWQALHYACANGHYGMAAWLLENGADLRSRTDEGWQPIHVAAHTGQTQLARFLVAQGADLRAQTKTGHEVVHLATDAGAVRGLSTAPFARATHALLLPFADVALPAMCVRARKTQLDFVQWLLRTTNGAVATAVDDDGWLPVHNAAHAGHMPLLKLFLNPPLPAKPADLNAITSDGFTTLHLAAIAGHGHTAKWLLTKGADPSATTSDGLTAERLASISGHGGVERFLAGATTASTAATVTSAAVFALARGDGADEGDASRATGLSPKRRKKQELASERVDRLQKRWESGSEDSSSYDASVQSGAPGIAAPAPTMAQPALDKQHSEADDLKERDAQFYQSLIELVKRTELHAAVNIQERWRRRNKLSKPLAGMAASAFARAPQPQLAPPPPPPRRVYVPAPAAQAPKMTGKEAVARGMAPAPGVINPVTARLGMEVRAQAAHYIDSTLSRSLLVKHLKSDLAIMMEKGKVYQPRGAKSQLVAWRTRFFYCSDSGLCYQKVSRTSKPYGEPRLIPWGAFTKIEALLDDSIYIETLNQKRYYLKPKGAESPDQAAWMWATRLCQLCQLLGNEVAGYVAMAAYGSVPKGPTEQDGFGSFGGTAGNFGDVPPHQAGISVSDDPFGYIEDDGSYDPKLVSARLPAPTGHGPAPEADRPAPYTDLASISDPSQVVAASARAPAPGGALPDEDEGEEDEGEETADEAYRRRQWIIYYVSSGAFSEAEDIGWDGRSPPDPRTAGAPGGAAPAPAAGLAPPESQIFYAKPRNAASQATAAPAPSGASSGRGGGRGRGRGGAQYTSLTDSEADAPFPASPVVVRSSALGWLQNRMSQIGRSPSTLGSNQTPAPAPASADEPANITPIAMAPLSR